MADLSKITLPNGSTYDLKDTTARAMTGFYVGTCATAAGTKDKVVTLTDATGFELKAGVVVAVKFSYNNSYSSSTANPITLNVNSTGAKNIWFNVNHSGASNTGTNNTAYGTGGRYIFYVYDGSYWCWINHSYDNDTNYHMPSCVTAAGTAAKVVYCTYYALKEDSYIPVLFDRENTAASALTLNINSKGAKPLWINGVASSSSNHTLPAGTYIVYYDGTNYYLRTDGKLTGDITGNAATANTATSVSSISGFLKNNGTTETSGNYALDAAYGKTLKDSIDYLSSRLDITSQVTVNSNLTVDRFTAYRLGNVVMILGTFSVTGDITNGQSLLSKLPDSGISATPILVPVRAGKWSVNPSKYHFQSLSGTAIINGTTTLQNGDFIQIKWTYITTSS